MSKTIETMIRVGMSQGEFDMYSDALKDQARDYMRSILAAMCEGEALDEMVDRASEAIWLEWGDGQDQTPEDFLDEAKIAIRAALTVEP